MKFNYKAAFGAQMHVKYFSYKSFLSDLELDIYSNAIRML